VGGFEVGVAGVVEVDAVLRAPFEFEEDGEDAEAAAGFGGVEEGVDAGGGCCSDIEEAAGEEAVAEADFELAGVGGAVGEVIAEEGGEGVGDVVVKALFMEVEEGVDLGAGGEGAEGDGEIGISVPSAALGFGAVEFCENDAEGSDVVEIFSEDLFIVVELFAEMAPSF